jgi:hypothetical protein
MLCDEYTQEEKDRIESEKENLRIAFDKAWEDLLELSRTGEAVPGLRWAGRTAVERLQETFAVFDFAVGLDPRVGEYVYTTMLAFFLMGRKIEGIGMEFYQHPAHEGCEARARQED